MSDPTNDEQVAWRLEHPALFICDLQERFRSVIWEFDKIILTTKKLLLAARFLRLPVYITTQNCARLGPTVPELATLLDDRALVPLATHADKTRFSMMVPDVTRSLHSASAVALVGIEAHICVTQTALDLLAAGHRVYVIADGVSSCNREEVPVALARLRAEGAVVTTSESFLYELMGDAAVPEFGNVLGLVKEAFGATKTSLQALLSRI